MYARVPDSYAFDARVITAGNGAVGALARMSSWSAGNSSDGFVPDAVVGMIATRREITALEESGLLERVAAGEKRLSAQRIGNKHDVLVVFDSAGVWLTDYLTWNFSAAEGREHSERGKKGGRASAAARATRQVEPRAEPNVQPQVDAGSSSQVQLSPVKSNDPSPKDERDKKHPTRDVSLARVFETEDASAARAEDTFAVIAAREVES